MLARRFTIICLVLTIFSMVFAALAARAGRTERSWQNQAGAACLLEQSPNCGFGRRY